MESENRNEKLDKYDGVHLVMILFLTMASHVLNFSKMTSLLLILGYAIVVYPFMERKSPKEFLKLAILCFIVLILNTLFYT